MEMLSRGDSSGKEWQTPEKLAEKKWRNQLLADRENYSLRWGEVSPVERAGRTPA